MACKSCDCETAVIVSFGEEPTHAHIHCANCGGCWIVFRLTMTPEDEMEEDRRPQVVN
jgi:hypothetical protein